MRRTLAIGVALLAGFVFASPTGAATPTERKLTRQIGALQKQVKTLQRQVKTLQKDSTELQGLAGLSLNYGICTIAAVTDAFQGTWATMNTFAARALFPATTPPVSDQIGNRGACERLEVARAPTVPPGITAFDSLIKVFR